MIERFNFYDVFGFFIPGSVLLLTLWLPFGMLEHRGPTSELASAVIAIVIAYIAGHFLQALATRAYPSSKGGRTRSSVMLDPGEPTLPDSLRQAFILRAKRELGLDVAAPAELPDSADGQREAAFFLAREKLIANKTVGYAEQFQGLYTMMRGNMVASTLGAFYMVGWIVAVPALVSVVAILLLFVTAGALIAIGYDPKVDELTSRERRIREQRHAVLVLWLLHGALLLIGFVLSGTRSVTIPLRLVFLGAFSGFCALAFQSSRSYEVYADEFAKAVYHGFVQLAPINRARDPFD